MGTGGWFRCISELVLSREIVGFKNVIEEVVSREVI